MIHQSPPIRHSKLTRSGKLVLRTEEHRGEEKLIANTTGSAASASMLDSGNLVLYNDTQQQQPIWQSFDFPTDTILGGQNLSMGMRLTSHLSDTDHSTGQYEIILQTDGNLVLYPLNTEESPTDAYYASGTDRYAPLFLSFNHSTGTLALINSTSLEAIRYLNSGLAINNNYKTIIYRATLYFGGFFKLNSHKFNARSGESQIQNEWIQPADPCAVRNFCGFNSFCTFNDNQPYCLCVPGTDFIDANKWSLGCDKNFSRRVCKDGIENDTNSFYITTMENMKWGDFPYIQVMQVSMEDCKKSCLEDCNCEAASFVASTCRKHSLPVRYFERVVGGRAFTALFKVRVVKSEKQPLPQTLVSVRSRKEVMSILLVTIGLLTSSCVALAILGIYVYKFRVLKYKRLLQYGNLGITLELTLHLFSYSELKKATNGFKEEVGKGSFGAVYEGTLCRGKKLIAVTRLQKVVEEGEREFQAEIRAIGRRHHRNLVQLLGYCIEGSRRLLVCEYMSNGSLADLLNLQGAQIGMRELKFP
ncbi:hypothetical protein HYC85_020369 [Camellia sinensis]|uniref:non-specific serine/threonine protein kinase n=1 Tax=Camellia sinensis TaxID=4442 RepID=A0A7J7GQI9_CAMSI|nr:hypothetical protein HYC85_020369 [Camellia sinensis]